MWCRDSFLLRGDNMVNPSFDLASHVGVFILDEVISIQTVWGRIHFYFHIYIHVVRLQIGVSEGHTGGTKGGNAG